MMFYGFLRATARPIASYALMLPATLFAYRALPAPALRRAVSSSTLRRAETSLLDAAAPAHVATQNGLAGHGHGLAGHGLTPVARSPTRAPPTTRL